MTNMQVLTDEDLNECLPLGIAPHQTIVGADEVIRLARAIESAVLAKVADRLRDAAPLFYGDQLESYARQAVEEDRKARDPQAGVSECPISSTA